MKTSTLGLTLALAISSPLALAQSYPSKPIRLVVPAGPASPLDIISRWIVDGMAKDLGQSFVVENRPGGLALPAYQDVLRGPSDGYTVLVISMPMTVTPSIAPNYPVNPRRDFDPVSRTVYSYNALVVSPEFPAKTISELVTLLKSQPGKRSFISGGTGTPAHVVGELFKLETGVDVLHVPYVNLAIGFTDLMGGRVDYGYLTTAPVIPHVLSGKLRALAVTSPHRLSALPDIPTVIEAGFPRLQVSDWGMFLVKAGTDRSIIDRLNASVNAIMRASGTAATIAKFGAEPASSSVAEAGRFLEAELERWGKLARAANIKVE
jgi:tripartite-type tricarboxylate transporter receptor subunit TctC